MSEEDRLAAWIEWRKQCLFAECGESAQVVLRNWADRVARSAWSGTLTEQLDCSWHYFETNVVVVRAEQSKAAKVSMFAAAASAGLDDAGRLRVIEAYAEKCMFSALRNVAVNETWHKRGSGGRFKPIPIDPTDGVSELPLEEVGPESTFRGLEPDSKVAYDELMTIGKSQAAAFLKTLNSPAIAGLGALFLTPKLPLSNPNVIRFAGCQGSYINEARRSAVIDLAMSLHRQFMAENDIETVNLLRGIALRELGERCASLLSGSDLCDEQHTSVHL